MDNIKKIEQGEKLYDSFVEKIYPFARVATPRTNSLELFAVLREMKKQDLLVAEMCREFISNFDDGYFVENSKLQRTVSVNVSVEDD